MTESDFELVRGSGNVFRDFNDPHADLKQAKAILAARIIAVLDERSLSVCKAARLTAFAAPDCDERIHRFMKERWGKKYHSDECQQMTAKLHREQRKREKWEKQSELEKAKKTLH